MADSGQLDIFTPLPDPGDNRMGWFHAPERGAPETERGAALFHYPRSGTARLRVLSYIATRGDTGATDEEVSLALRMRLYTAAPRRKELLDDGWVEDSGRRRKTQTGARATVWCLTPRGRVQYLARMGTPDG